MQSDAKVVCACISDIHFSHKAPIARSAESSWYEAMDRQLVQVHDLLERHQVPLIVAGDIFDKWNSCSELVNFVLNKMPPFFGIPGQHDLPFHSYDDIKKSSFWTLAEAGLCHLLPYGQTREAGEVRLHGFPWGAELVPLRDKSSFLLDIAVVHRYVWKKGYSHPSAKDEDRVGNLASVFAGYDCVVIGDNHKAWQWKNISNLGGFFRRKLDEINYEPSVTLIYSDGTMKKEKLDCSKDKFIAPEDVSKHNEDIDLQEFLQELTTLSDSAVSYPENVKRAMENNKVSNEVRKIILAAME